MMQSQRHPAHLALAPFFVLLLTLMLGVSVSLAAEDSGEGEGGGDISTEDVEDTIRQLREEGSKIRFQPVSQRDPFVSLVVDVGPQTQKGPRPPGFEGHNVAELRVEGIWLGTPSGGGAQAFFRGRDGKNYRQKAGDKCFNGKIIAVNADRVIFEEYQYDSNGQPRPPKIVSLFIDRKEM